MKNIDQTVTALMTLLDNAESDFEKSKIEILIRDLTEPQTSTFQKVCPNCGNIFFAKKKTQQFCSRHCSGVFNQAKRHSK